MNANTTSKDPIFEKLIYLRENNGLSVKDLAAHIGIEIKQLESIEAGSEDLLDESLLEKFSNVFQVPLSYLTEASVQDDSSYSFLTRAMEKLSENDHDELVKFAEFLKSSPRGK